MNSLALNYWAIVVYGVLIAVVITLVAFFLEFDPFHTVIHNLIIRVQGLGTDNTIISALTKAVSENWMTIVGAGAPIALASGVALINNYRYKQELEAKKQLAELQTKTAIDLMNTNTAQQTAQSELEALKQKLSLYEGDTTATDLQTRLSAESRAWELEKANLMGRVSALQEEILKLKAMKEVVYK